MSHMLISGLLAISTVTAAHPPFPDTLYFRQLQSFIKRQNEYDQYSEGGVPYPGEQPLGGQLRSRIPVNCRDDCYWPSSVYSGCFHPVVIPEEMSERGCALLCRQDWYDYTAACLTCIVENGGETDEYGGNVAFPGKLSNDLIDADFANEMLLNITERCEADFESVESTLSFTATPTTTGTYTMSWTSGETVNVEPWTGMTQYATMYPIEYIFPSQQWSSAQGLSRASQTHRDENGAIITDGPGIGRIDDNAGASSSAQSSSASTQSPSSAARPGAHVNSAAVYSCAAVVAAIFAGVALPLVRNV